MVGVDRPGAWTPARSPDPRPNARSSDLLRQYGVTIPAELVPEVTPHGRRKGQEELDEVANGPDGRGRKAKIDPEVGPESKRKADEDIKTVTDPAKPRVAPIYAQASGLQAAEIALERVARTRTADVYIVVHHPDGSTSGSTGGGTSGGGGGGFGPFSVGPTALAAPVPALTSGGGGYGAMTIPVAAPSQPVDHQQRPERRRGRRPVRRRPGDGGRHPSGGPTDAEEPVMPAADVRVHHPGGTGRPVRPPGTPHRRRPLADRPVGDRHSGGKRTGSR